MKLLTFITVISSLSVSFAAPEGSPALPSADDFYNPPAGYESQPLGAILKSRPVPDPIDGLSYSKAYQLLYRTSTASGDPEADVTTVIVPKGDAKDVLLSYQVPEDAAWVGCAPSYSLMTSNSSDVQAILDQGWYLNVPDYEGPLSSFTAGIHSGYSTLDSIKAALASGADTGIQDSSKVGLWGYSGGSIAVSKPNNHGCMPSTNNFYRVVGEFLFMFAPHPTLTFLGPLNYKKAMHLI